MRSSGKYGPSIIPPPRVRTQALNCLSKVALVLGCLGQGKRSRSRVPHGDKAWI